MKFITPLAEKHFNSCKIVAQNKKEGKYIVMHPSWKLYYVYKTIDEITKCTCESCYLSVAKRNY